MNLDIFDNSLVKDIMNNDIPLTATHLLMNIW